MGTQFSLPNTSTPQSTSPAVLLFKHRPTPRFLLPPGTNYWSPPPAANLGPSYGVPAASCVCTGGTVAQSIAAGAAKGWPLLQPDNVACSLFVSATIPAFPAWVCSDSPAAPAKGIVGEKVNTPLLAHWAKLWLLKGSMFANRVHPTR